jgi:hypothetical protein
MLLFSIMHLGCIFFSIDKATIDFQHTVLLIVHSERLSLTPHLSWLDVCGHVIAYMVEALSYKLEDSGF